MNNGWISLYRQFLDWEWYDDINTKSLFIHLLLKANHKDANWRGKIIKRGQTFTSIKHLSSEINLTYKQIRTSLGKLKRTGEIVIQGANDGTLISVINYDTYQTNELTEGNPKVKPKAIKGQAKVKQRATNNNNNNKNNKDNKDKFNSEIFSEKNKQKYGTQLLDEFYLFYSEPTQDGKKMKFQTFDTWSTAGRLATWSKKDYNGYYKLHRDELFRRGQNKPKPIVDESELDPQGLNDYMKKLSKQIGRS
tara:strand:- start:5150 stop:5899 length:750 start_codon:yes stop_codon:yes gene_type:complete